MRKLLSAPLLAALGFGVWYFLQHYHVAGLEKIVLQPRDPSATAPADAGAPAAASSPTGTIRVCSFNIQVFGTSKINKPRVANILAEVVRKFDVVAIQEVRAKTNDLLPRFIELINANGRRYDFVIGPRLGRSNSKEQYAFVYDTATVEVDREALYTVADPDDRLHREPLVAWFRVRGPPPDQAFTFSLIDIHTDPDEVKTEVAALADVYRAVRDDGRREDDIILLGDLNADDHHFGALAEIPNIMWAISGVPSNTRGNKLYDNMLFSRAATTEFTGRAGVFDLIREFNLTLADALEVSDHMPIWAEFSVYEGGQSGRIASQPRDAR